MSDFNFSLGFTTDTAGLRVLDKEFNKLDEKIKKVVEMMNKPNISPERYQRLANVYSSLNEKANLVIKAHGELDSMLKNAARDGLSLERVFVQLGAAAAKDEKPLATFINQLKQASLAMQGMQHRELTSFLGRLEGALGQVTSAVQAQAAAIEKENRLTQENIRLKEQQTRATQASAAARREAAAAAIPDQEESTGVMGGRFLGTAKQALLTAPIYSAAYAATGSVQQAITDYIKVDTVLNRIAIVTGQTTDQVREMKEEFMASARALSTSTEEYVKGAQTFFAQGGKAAEYATDLTKASIQLSNATGQSAEDTAQYVTAIGNSFKLIEQGEPGIQKIADTLLYLDNASATSADEIGQAMRRSASSFQSAGIEYERASAMIATVSEVTRQAPERVGTAFKTIVETIQEVKEAGPKEMKAFTSKIQQTIDTFPSLKDKLQLFDETGTQMVSTTEFFKQLQGTFAEIKNVDPMAANALAQTIGGKENANILAALLENYERFDELLTGIQTESIGSAQRAQEEYQNSLQAKIDELKGAWEEFINKIISSGALTNIIETLTKAVDLMTAALGESHQLFKLITAIVVLKFGPGIVKAFMDARKEGTSVMGDFLKLDTLISKIFGLDSSNFNAQIEETKIKEQELTAEITKQEAAIEAKTEAIKKQKAAIEANQAAQAAETDPNRRRVLENIGRSQQTRLARSEAQLEGQRAELQTTRDQVGEQQGRRRRTGRARNIGRAAKVGGAGILGTLGAVGMSVITAKMSGDERDVGSILKEDAGNLIGGGIGGLIGMIFGPVGAMVGSMIGSWVGSWIQEMWGSGEKKLEEEKKKKNQETYDDLKALQKLEEKKRSGKAFTLEELRAYEKLNAKLGEHKKLVNDMIALDQQAAAAKEAVTEAQENYLKAIKGEDLGDKTGNKGSIAAITAAENQVNIVKAKSIMMEQLLKQSGSMTIEEYEKVSKQIREASVQGMDSLKEVFDKNKTIFDPIKNNFIDIYTTSKSSLGGVLTALKTTISNFSTLSKDQAFEQLKAAFSSLGISDKDLQKYKDNSAQMLQILNATQKAAADYEVFTKAKTRFLLEVQEGKGKVSKETVIDLLSTREALAGNLGVTVDEVFQLGSYDAPLYDGFRNFYDYFFGDSKRYTGLIASSVGALSQEQYMQRAIGNKLPQIAATVPSVATGATMTPPVVGGTLGQDTGTKTDTETFKNKQIQRLQKSEKDVALEEERLLKSYDKQLELVKKGNASLDKKSKDMEDLYVKKIKTLGKARNKYDEALAESMGAAPLKNIKVIDGYFAEESIQAERDRLENAITKAEDKFLAGQKSGKSEKELKSLYTAIDAATKRLKEFNNAISAYNPIAGKAKAATDKLREAFAEMSSDIISVKESLLEETITKAFFGKTSLEEMQSYFDSLLSFQNDFLNNTEKMISLAEIQNKLDQDKLKYGSSPQLLAFQEKITKMKASDAKFSKEEVSLLDAEYDLILKQILLKKSQMGSQETRLMRDARGNWVYAAADQEKSKGEKLAAQGEVISSANRFYEQARGTLTESLKKDFDLRKEIAKKLTEKAELDRIQEFKYATTEQKANAKQQSDQIKDLLDKVIVPQFNDNRETIKRQSDIFNRAAKAAGAAGKGSDSIYEAVNKALTSSEDVISEISKEIEELKIGIGFETKGLNDLGLSVGTLATSFDQFSALIKSGAITDPFVKALYETMDSFIKSTNEILERNTPMAIRKEFYKEDKIAFGNELDRVAGVLTEARGRKSKLIQEGKLKEAEEVQKKEITPAQDYLKELLTGVLGLKVGTDIDAEGNLITSSKLASKNKVSVYGPDKKERTGYLIGGNTYFEDFSRPEVGSIVKDQSGDYWKIISETQREKIGTELDKQKQLGEIEVPILKTGEQEKYDEEYKSYLQAIAAFNDTWNENIEPEVKAGIREPEILKEGETKKSDDKQLVGLLDPAKIEDSNPFVKAIQGAIEEVIDEIVPGGGKLSREDIRKDKMADAKEKSGTKAIVSKPTVKTPATKAPSTKAPTAKTPAKPLTGVDAVNEEKKKIAKQQEEEYNKKLKQWPSIKQKHEKSKMDYLDADDALIEKNRPDTYSEKYKDNLNKIKSLQGTPIQADPKKNEKIKALESENANLITQSAKNRTNAEKAMNSAAKEKNDLLDFLNTYEKSRGLKLTSLATGGYTGEFSGGKLGVLHSKELVLNKDDTKNILEAVKIVREYMGMFANNANNIVSSIKNNSVANTTVINASFPNVSSSEEIRKAFANMSNNAAQFAYKMRPSY